MGFRRAAARAVLGGRGLKARSCLRRAGETRAVKSEWPDVGSVGWLAPGRCRLAEACRARGCLRRAEEEGVGGQVSNHSAAERGAIGGGALQGPSLPAMVEEKAGLVSCETRALLGKGDWQCRQSRMAAGKPAWIREIGRA